MTNQIAEDIREGVKYLEAHGWCQSVHTDEVTGKVCIYGGIDNSLRERLNVPLGSPLWSDGNEPYSRGQLAKRFVDSYVAKKYPAYAEYTWPAAVWNDEPTRNVSAVRGLMLAAALEAEGRIYPNA